MRDSLINRRKLLQAAMVAGAGLALPVGTAGALTRQATIFGVSADAFPLSSVSLLPGPFPDNMNRTLSYLSFVDPDRLLHTFRLNVGLPSTAQPCGGWEDPTVELRGHSTGHLLSALAQAHANTGKAALQTKGAYLVSSLAACQAASPAAGYHTGYLSAYPENFFERLESGQQVWAPYYTIHKIMAGLLDQYQLAGNAQALTVLTNMAAWVKRSGCRTADQRTGRAALRLGARRCHAGRADRHALRQRDRCRDQHRDHRDPRCVGQHHQQLARPLPVRRPVPGRRTGQRPDLRARAECR